jgi:glycosyltransferase involved in cell wall biosynthesis
MHVCYCHTPPRFLWQYSERYEGSSIKGRVWKRFVELLRRWDRRAVQRVDHFIANSENVRRRIKRFYDREAAVVYPQVDLLERVRDFEPSGENGGYYLVVSRLDEMKRVEVIVEAFNTSGKPLVIVGTGKLDARMLASANKNISFTGFLTDRELCLYYDRCEALVIAAIDEDFGITAVEAQLFGKPVIAPAEGGFLETVVDGETGVLYEMDGPPSIVKAVERARMIQFDTNRIKENAARFSKAAFIQGISTELARIGVAIPK